jgi:succinate-semialdehyde dehydrogenase/glutarate-semialdehyde dehydrogenase
MPLTSIHPVTGEVLRSYAVLTEAELATRLDRAADAQRRHAATPIEHRVLCLRKLAALLKEERTTIAIAITQETGKLVAQARAEVDRSVAAAMFYAEHAARILAPEPVAVERGQAYLQWSPVGLVLGVVPWESPVWHGLSFALPNLAAGNGVLMKHAGSVTGCALLLELLVRRAGFEANAYAALPIEDADAEKVLNDERVSALSVMGNDTVCRALAAKAGWLMKKSVLQLPGSDPLLVMPSAHLEDAVAAALQAMTGAAGAGVGKRLIVHTAVFHDFLHRLVVAVEALKVGDPADEVTEIGPLGTATAVQVLAEQVAAAVAAGGRLVTGGKRIGPAGSFFEPTLLTDVPRASAMFRDALLGPVAVVFRARDLAHAVEIANDRPSALGASVWTAEPGEQQALIAAVEAGTVAVNALPEENPRLPWGGGRRSGYGRALGAAGMREFLIAKAVLVGS